MNLNKNIIIIAVVAILVIAGLGWAYMESVKPLPGQEVLWDDRTHKPPTEKLEYPSNPPTSGPHYEIWIKPGVYDQPQADGNLVHSLEHGYIIMSYNCDRNVTGNNVISDKLVNRIISPAFAQEEIIMQEASESGVVASESAQLSANFQSDACKDLASKLNKIYEDKGKRKLIVTPRPQLDSQIALTAWGRVDKFDGFDKGRITTFIDKLRDHGPEMTSE